MDFAKVYDTVHLNFLDSMLKNFNFCEKWRGWIRECVSPAYAFVLVNGSPLGEFKLQRGLRQGDPLSPLLYLLVAEGLSILTSKAMGLNLFEPAVLGTENVVISHLQYAGDMIFMVAASMENARTLKCILKNFELLSGLKINYSKS